MQRLNGKGRYHAATFADILSASQCSVHIIIIHRQLDSNLYALYIRTL